MEGAGPSRILSDVTSTSRRNEARRWTRRANSAQTKRVRPEARWDRGISGRYRWLEHRYRHRTCGRTFAATAGTPFYRLHPAVETVTLVLTLLAHEFATLMGAGRVRAR